MAASMKFHKVSSLLRFSSQISVVNQNKLFYSNASHSIITTEDDEVQYPSIRPKYPPGIWGEITPEKAWEIQEVKESLLAKHTAKTRLEEIAGVAPGRRMFIINSVDNQPKALLYKQYLTKTSIIESLPECMKHLEASQKDKLVKRLKPLVIDELLLEDDYIRKSFTSSHWVKLKENLCHQQQATKRIIDTLISNMCFHIPHLQKSQVDDNVNVQSFWHRIACCEDIGQRPGVYNYKEGRLWFQGIHKASTQIRSRLPLPEIISMDDELCHGKVKEEKYYPPVYGVQHLKRRSFNMAGHWNGDPCEFTLMSVHNTNEKFDIFIQNFGKEFLDEATTNYGMTASFLSCSAQAHNQGFNWLTDMTYPIVTQSVVTNGQWFQFMTYQLNTLRLWISDEANTLRNLCWTSKRMPLYDVIENGEVKGFNDDVLGQLVECIAATPQDRGINLRPYLPPEQAPSQKIEFINSKGEEPLPFHKPGQHEFPSDSMYYQQNV